jgi:penicillin-binding protein 1A
MKVRRRSGPIASPATPAPQRGPGRLARLLGFALNAGLVLCVVAAGLGSGFAFGLLERAAKDLPRLEMLAEHEPSELTTVFSRDGRILDRFFLENRVVVPLSQIPQDLKNAVFAIEDARFYEHHGIDVYGMFRAAWKNLKAGEIVEGASTITQQWVRTLLQAREKAYARKLKEMVLAWRLEERFTKEQILEMYFNEIYLGNGAYGVEAAARTYFGKGVEELTLGECAILAAIPKAPELYNPKDHPTRARRRQRMILDRMVETGFVRRPEADAAFQAPVQLKKPAERQQAARYFVEHVRQRVEKELGSSAVHRGGLRISTTLDLELQQAAERALRKGLRDYDKRHGYRGPLTPGAPVVHLGNAVAPGVRLLARVLRVGAKGVEVDVLTAPPGKRPDVDAEPDEIARTPGIIETSVLRQRWVGRVTDRLRPGDLVLVEVLDVPGNGGPAKLALEQEPEVQGAIVCLDPFRGEVLAMVGGYDFGKSEFNRAIQARRQPGSSFKLFIYLTALQRGLTPATLVYDTAVVEQQGGADGKLWKPRNYYDKFFGKTTLRHALEHSYNPVAVKLLERVGIDPVIRNARRLGLSSELAPDLSLGLGSSGVSLLEMTAAYGSMAAGGLNARPYFIRRVEDRDGNLLDEEVPQVHRAVAPDVAYVMVRLLQGVVQNGTGKRARVLNRPIGGKTGTTNDHHDAWFLGFSPQIVAGVWVGFDDMRISLGKGEAGAQAAAPIWIEFMQQALARYESEPFAVPEGVVQADIDPDSGLLATPQCHRVLRETFVAGTVPTLACDRHAVSVADFDQLDSVAEPELGVSGGPAGPVEVVDPSEITAPKPGEALDDEVED